MVIKWANTVYTPYNSENAEAHYRNPLNFFDIYDDNTFVSGCQ